MSGILQAELWVLGTKMHRVLWVSLSAALLSARLSGSAEAAYTPEDFTRIENYIEAGNWVNLRTYLTDNPHLLDGDDPFTLELLKFLNSTQSLYTALVFEPALFPDLSRATPQRPASNRDGGRPAEPPARAEAIPSQPPTIY